MMHAMISCAAPLASASRERDPDVLTGLGIPVQDWQPESAPSVSSPGTCTRAMRLSLNIPRRRLVRRLLGDYEFGRYGPAFGLVMVGRRGSYRRAPGPGWAGRRAAAMMAGSVSRGRRAVRRLLAALLAVLTGALGALVLYYTSLQPGAAMVAAVFNQNALVTPPPGFGQVARAVTEQRVPIPAPDAPWRTWTSTRRMPREAKPRPVILWVHGGGFISSSAATVADYAILLAHAGYTVASLDYSLAPGARYPVPVRQGNAALRYLRANAARFGGDPDRIVLGGDSAGAQIASQLAAMQTRSCAGPLDGADPRRAARAPSAAWCCSAACMTCVPWPGPDSPRCAPTCGPTPAPATGRPILRLTSCLHPADHLGLPADLPVGWRRRPVPLPGRGARVRPEAPTPCR